jgi:hypothetical protein
MNRWMGPWLARLSYSFFILAGLLIWQSLQALQGKMGHISNGRIALFWCGALASFGLGVAGILERHRPRHD